MPKIPFGDLEQLVGGRVGRPVISRLHLDGYDITSVLDDKVNLAVALCVEVVELEAMGRRLRYERQ